ncbi:MAG: hypothetical protein PHP35_03040, partial [Candidatus Colwellbacteria bacterium]|nr:hypothetical protein [Candidatus Colwellbacteria bacterium]
MADFDIVFRQGVTGGAAIQRESDSATRLVIDSTFASLPQDASQAVFKLLFAETFLRDYLENNALESEGMKKKMGEELALAEGAIGRKEQIDDSTLAYYYKIATYYYLDAAGRAEIIRALAWFDAEVKRDPLHLKDMVTAADNYSKEKMPEISQVGSLAASHFALTAEAKAPNALYIRLRAALAAKLPQDAEDRGFDVALFAVARNLYRGISQDETFAGLMTRFFEVVGALNEAKAGLQESWKVTTKSKPRLATLVAGTRNIFLLYNNIAAASDVSQARMIWSIFYKMSGSVLGTSHSSHLSAIYEATSGMPSFAAGIYSDMRRFFIARMGIRQELIDTGVDIDYKSRFNRLQNISALKINKKPAPVVVRNFSVAQLNSRVNFVRWTIWGHNTLYMLDAHRRLFLQGEIDSNLIIANPWEQEPIYTGDSIQLRTGLLLDKEGRLTLAEFSEPITVHYLAYSFKAEEVRVIESLGIPYQCATPIHSVARDKRLAMAAVEGIPGLRLPREIHIDTTDDREAIAGKVHAFAATGIKEFVVKPPRGMGGKNIKFFSAETEVEETIDWTDKINNKDGVIVQESITCPLVSLRGVPSYWNLRIYLSRDREGRVGTGGEEGTAVRIGPDKVVNICKGASVIRLSELIRLLGFDAAKKKAFLEEFEAVSVNCFYAVERYAASLHNGGYYREILGGTSYSEADHIGLDLMWDGEHFAFIEANDFSGGLSGLAKAKGEDDDEEEAGDDGQSDGSIKTFYVTAERKARIYQSALNTYRARQDYQQYGKRMLELSGAMGVRLMLEILDLIPALAAVFPQRAIE